MDAFSEEKTVKIKKFAKEYIAKVVRKIKEKRKKQQPRQPSSGSGCSRRDSLVDGDVDGDDLDAEGEGEEMSAEALKSMMADAIDIGEDDDGDNKDGEGDDMDVDDQEACADDNERTGLAVEENSPDDADMVVTPIQIEVKDPRLRLRVESDGDGESGWEMNQVDSDPMAIKQGTLISRPQVS